MLAIISFILIILIIVSVHEYGHYVAARYFGVRVLRFSVGFGKPLLLRRDRHGTEWVLAPVPLGGYVRMLDAESAAQHNYPPEEAIEAKSHWQRIIIYAAGPFANIVLSFVLLLVILSNGEQGLRPLVENVRATSPAATAGISGGDEIAAINDTTINTWRQVEVALADNLVAGGDIQVAMVDGAVYEIAAVPEALAEIETLGSPAAVLGLVQQQNYIKLQIATVQPDSPAAAAGVRVGDTLIMLNGIFVERWDEAVQIIAAHPQQPIPVVVWRDNSALTVTVTPSEVKRGRRKVGYMGISPTIDRAALAPLLVTVSYSPPELVVAAVKNTGQDIARAVSFVRLLISGGASRTQVSGPVGIATQSADAAMLGFGVWLRFVTLISTSLGILNLLPLPLLDGGQILLSVLQCVSRRKFSDKTLRLWHISGAAILLALMTFIIINDIVQLF